MNASARNTSSCEVVDQLSRTHWSLLPNVGHLLLCKWVSGRGFCDSAPVERCFVACFEGLRPSDVLVVGWSDVKTKLAFPLREYPSLRIFGSLMFPPLGTAKFVPKDISYRHTYSFCAMPSSATTRVQ